MSSIKLNENLIFHSWMCVKSHLWVIPSTQKKEFWFYVSLIRSYSSNKMKSVKPIVIRSVASFGEAQKCDHFWHPGTESFPMVYDIIDFLMITFSRYYTLITVIALFLSIWPSSLEQCAPNTKSIDSWLAYLKTRMKFGFPYKVERSET